MAETVPTSYPLDQLAASGMPNGFVLTTIAIIAPNRDLVDELRGMPFTSVRYQHFSSSAPDFVERALKIQPSVVVVCSDGGSVISGRKICSLLKKEQKRNIPIVYVNNGEYPKNLDFEAFADVDVLYPHTFEERFNLVIELGRTAHNVLVPSVKIGPFIGSRSRGKWALVAIPVTSILSGAIALWLTTDPRLAAQFALAMAFVTIGMELSPGELRQLISRYLSGSR